MHRYEFKEKYMNISLKSSGQVSTELSRRGMMTFDQACEWVKNLPYKRNQDKSDIFCVFRDGGGTCSTKHALLRILAEENHLKNVKLMLAIFKMNAQNTPKIANVLQKYHLKEMPEAHNYLQIDTEILDCARRHSSPEDFVNDLVEEIEIEPDQIIDFKIKYHKNFLQKYLQENNQIPYSTVDFWQIREECIVALQQ